MGAAADRWRDALAAWAIPDEILAAAPESPYGFSVDLFARVADARHAEGSPATRRALEALPDGGTVLDVGAGAGAASLPLAAKAGRLVAVDESPGMLEAYAQRAEAAGVEHATVQGRWPEAASAAPVADVVVCRNVLYNVADVDGFVAALTGHARVRVVIEFQAEHPLAWTNPYFEAIHRIRRPLDPTADDAIAAIAESGVDARHVRWTAPSMIGTLDRDELVGFLRRRLCVGAERDGEIAAAVGHLPPPAEREVVACWWDGRAAAAGS